MRSTHLLLGLFALFLVFGCGQFSTTDSEDELVLAATGVGVPEGEKVTKEIGPTGGSLTSPDGRMTLTVPKGALTETIAFSMQPITNTAEGGLGLAYRLEPDGKTFTTPLEISVRYADQDLEGTVPDALALAYQDPEGGWHLHEEATLDQNSGILTVRTTHFTDWSFLARMRIFPEKATVRVGETVQLKLVPCHHHQNGMLDRLRRWAQGTQQPCEVTDKKNHWTIMPNWFVDIGTIKPPREITVIYTAPSTKPNPNIATVSLPYELEEINSGTVWGGGTYASKRGMFIAKITIVDRGYKATGNTADLFYSGAICSLEQPFTVNGSLIGYKFEFTPATPTKGTVEISAAGMMVKAEGGGSYYIDGAGTDTPRIVISGAVVGHAPVGSKTGSGTVYIDLLPLDSGECN